MPNRPPRTYDEIVRATVPDPDSSWRPSVEQEHRAHEGFRAMDPDEQRLCHRVHDTLLAAGIDTTRLKIEVDRNRVILRGEVRDAHLLMRIPDLVGDVEGVGSVIDQLVIAA
jgi:osmotically-inducible protein OsmY